jgi:FtsZ-interacting cell division protein ZipA
MLEGIGWVCIFGIVVIAALVVETGRQNRRDEKNNDDRNNDDRNNDDKEPYS